MDELWFEITGQIGFKHKSRGVFRGVKAELPPQNFLNNDTPRI